MLEGLFGSKAKVRIIRETAANPDRDYSVEDLARAVRMSYGTVHPAVGELASARALVTRKAGRSKLYKINEKHPMYKVVREMIKRERNAFMDIAKDFVKNLDKAEVESIVLFGSVARNEPHPGDIDLLIVTRSEKRPNNLDEATGNALDDSDTIISPICLSKKALTDKIQNLDSFIVGVMNEGKVLWGDAEWLKA
ncbi:MAG: nucleotidyltransferase domain-containing protein [Thermoplasmata archaeon]|nr:nucleotidyltransferase domain-containing protein [Thermoplasmata archaeon]